MTNKELISIAKARKEKGLIQKECAKLLGISSMYLCDIEKGRRCPQSEEFYNKVRDVLGLNFVNEKVKFLSEIANMELRDQLEAERFKVKELKELLKECRAKINRQTFGSPREQFFEGTFSNKLLEKIDEVLK